MQFLDKFNRHARWESVGASDWGLAGGVGFTADADKPDPLLGIHDIAKEVISDFKFGHARPGV